MILVLFFGLKCNECSILMVGIKKVRVFLEFVLVVFRIFLLVRSGGMFCF